MSVRPRQKSSRQPPVLGLWTGLLLLFYHCAGCWSLTEQLQLQSNGKLGLVVPLGIRHGVHRDRGRSLMRRSGITPVHGAVREGYFYAVLSLGTPPRQFSTIIDTGSTMTYIPCKKCLRCGRHMDEAFDPAKSATATVLGCKDARCNCGSPACSCKDQQCYYARHYAEMSSSEGWMVADKLAFPDNATGLDFVFGCENIETGAIYEQRVDGVLGMGNNINSFPRQLAASGQVDDVFSLCFGFPAGGSLLLGDVVLQPAPALAFTPLVDRHLHYYNVELEAIRLAGTTLPVTKAQYGTGYGAVLDSGTTFTYLPTPAFKAFLAQVEGGLKGSKMRRSSGADPQYNDICWRGGPRDFDGIDKIFPSGSITFAGGVSVALTPQRYLFLAGRGEYCLGVFDNGWQGTLIGGIIVRNVLVQYDKVRGRVGFAEVPDCNQLRQAPPAAAAAAAVPAATPEAAAGKPAAAAAAAAKGQGPGDEEEEEKEEQQGDREEGDEQADVELEGQQEKQQQQQPAAGSDAGEQDQEQQFRQQAQQPPPAAAVAWDAGVLGSSSGSSSGGGSRVLTALGAVAVGGLLSVAVVGAVQLVRSRLAARRGGRAGSDDDTLQWPATAAAAGVAAGVAGGGAGSGSLLGRVLGGVWRPYRAVAAGEAEDVETELAPLAAGRSTAAAV